MQKKLYQLILFTLSDSFILLLVGAGFAIFLLSSCAYLTARQVTQMTPEQIDAFAKIKMNVYGCLQIGGPPVDGGFTYIILPVDAKIDLAFSPNCMLLNSKITR